MVPAKPPKTSEDTQNNWDTNQDRRVWGAGLLESELVGWGLGVFGSLERAVCLGIQDAQTRPRQLVYRALGHLLL